MPEPWELAAWFDDYLDARNRHDLDELRRFLHPQVRRANAPGGVEAWLADLDDFVHAFPDHRWKRIGLVVEGDRIAAHLRTRGTHRGVYRGLEPTGARVSLAEFGIYRVEWGVITEYVGGLADGDAALRAQLMA